MNCSILEKETNLSAELKKKFKKLQSIEKNSMKNYKKYDYPENSRD